MASTSTSTGAPSTSLASSSNGVHPLAAKTAAAATGATLTALTMTPFDVIKTRMQTQPSSSAGAGPSTSKPSTLTAVCCQPAHSTAPCVRKYSSLTLHSASGPQQLHGSRFRFDFRPNTQAAQVVCIWDRQGVPHNERVTGFWDAARKVWRMEGVRGLWKGAGTTLVIAVPSQTLYMVTYDNLRRTMPFHESYALFTPLFAGIIARTMVSSISSPLELLRTRLQATPSNPNIPHTMKSVLSGIRVMTKRDGMRSLWRGLGPTLWRDVPFSGLYWAGFETIKGRLKRRGYEGSGATFVSGAVSGTTAAMVTLPFDVLKTRKQALQEVASHMRSSQTTATFPLLREIVRSEGPKALFAGLTPRIAKIAPACGIMIACYEGIEKYIDARMD
ncbi:hypothetical protein FRB95_002603 [Tulasnella sp. JGI-2019a]|nr:hypothetical protein FRB93_005700 [Tulasnella sp. JGI-2019a]KAG9038163.1 hypothetical protein FRB95_002603 [Tulasnella sp. JGI-2019a]